MRKGKRDAGEGTPPAAPKPRRKVSRKRVILLVVAVVLVAAAGVGIKTLFFSGEEQVALTERTTYGSLSTTIEGTGTTVPADSVTWMSW